MTDDDIDKVAEAVWTKAKHDLYLNAGKGLVNWVWRLFLSAMVVLSIYGASHGWFG